MLREVGSMKIKLAIAGGLLLTFWGSFMMTQFVFQALLQ
jgi:hypothetical protein